MNPQSLAASENWLGSYYELALELGPSGDDGRLARALAALWSHPLLAGPFRDRASLFEAPGRTGDDFSGDVLASRYGALALGEAQEGEARALGCVSHVIREGDVGSDWLDLCVPTGMLELVFPVSYPLTPAENPWMAGMDRLLAGIGAHVFAREPFTLGAIGEEVSGVVYAASLEPGACRGRILLLPEARAARVGGELARVVLRPGLVAIGLETG